LAFLKSPALNAPGTRKTGTYTLIPELLMNVFASIQLFLCHETFPAAVKTTNENGTAVVEVA
jgi:hypothetical protein